MNADRTKREDVRWRTFIPSEALRGREAVTVDPTAEFYRQQAHKKIIAGDELARLNQLVHKASSVKIGERGSRLN